MAFRWLLRPAQAGLMGVYEELTREKLKGEADRKRCKFCEDEALPEVVRALLSDYLGCGYGRR